MAKYLHFRRHERSNTPVSDSFKENFWVPASGKIGREDFHEPGAELWDVQHLKRKLTGGWIEVKASGGMFDATMNIRKTDNGQTCCLISNDDGIVKCTAEPRDVRLPCLFLIPTHADVRDSGSQAACTRPNTRYVVYAVSLVNRLQRNVMQNSIRRATKALSTYIGRPMRKRAKNRGTQNAPNGWRKKKRRS